ncbi:ATP-binding protein [Pseudoflavonifractor phocaeensis]|nr:ATP-binding protein [Pseudoflavonifractor phocaeensis]
MQIMTIPATVENLDKVIAFVDQQLERFQCPMETQFQIDVAVEEIYVNIAHYAYTPGQGEATIRCEVEEGPPVQVVIELLDNGVPYDPLAKADPDVSLTAEEREIGGLGIFMVKQSMDHVAYRYENGKNILTLRKTLHEKEEKA